MNQRLITLLLSLITAALLLAGCGRPCTARDVASCATNLSGCQAGCGGSDTACLEQCGKSYCECLSNAGCDTGDCK